MQINITGHHVEVTESLRNHINEKMKKITRHFDHMIQSHVIITIQKHNQIAEATLHTPGSDLFAKHETEDMYASIDGMVEKLDRQVLKYKEKMTDHRQKRGVINETN